VVPLIAPGPDVGNEAATPVIPEPSPLNDPVNEPVNIVPGVVDVTAVTLIVPAEKFPEASRATTLEAVLASVASTANVLAVEPLNVPPDVKYVPAVKAAVVAFAVVAVVAVEAFPVKAPTKVVDVTEDKPAIVVAEPPNDIAVEPTVTELFAKLAFVIPAVPDKFEFVNPEIRAKGTVPEAKLSAFKAVNAVPVPVKDEAETAPIIPNGLLNSILELPLLQVIEAAAPEINKPPPSASAEVVEPEAITTNLSLIKISVVLINVVVPDTVRLPVTVVLPFTVKPAKEGELPEFTDWFIEKEEFERTPLAPILIKLPEPADNPLTVKLPDKSELPETTRPLRITYSLAIFYYLL
jgi:hypothetical protein